MRVLGIDPASAGPMGYGVVESDGRRCRPVHYGALRPVSKSTPSARLREIHALVAKLVEEFEPDVVAVEDVFAALNMRTALKLAEVRGVVMLAAAESNIPVHSYSPREVKCTVAGYGNADKHQMQHMVRVLLNLKEAPSGSLGTDAADALAVALCHIQCAQAQARMAAATRPPAREASRALAGNGHRPALRKPRDGRGSRPRAARIQTLR